MLPRNRSVWFFPFFILFEAQRLRPEHIWSQWWCSGWWLDGPLLFLFLLRHHWPALYVRTNGVLCYVHASVCESTRNEIQRHLGRL